MIKLLVTLGALACIWPIQSPGLALIFGFFYAGFVLKEKPLPIVSKISKLILGWAIVGFGTTVTMSTILALSGQYFWLTASSIIITLIVAWYLGKMMQLDPALRALVGSGTAICGASAIASVGEGIKASAEQLSMALGVVLILNAIALVLFPKLGLILGMSGHDFAVWSGLAIHDTSSVVGAALSYDKSTVVVATTVKLARAIWIAPLTAFFASIFCKGEGKAHFKLPWFIWGYLIAATVSGYIEPPVYVLDVIKFSAATLFRIGLFLTGCAINFRQLAGLGLKPFILGVVLWIISACWSLWLI